MKKSQVFMTIFIAIILMSSVIGFLYVPEDAALAPGTKQYNNIQFVPGQNNKWLATFNNQQLLFDYLPEELSSISIPSTFPLNNPKLYLIMNATETSPQEYLLQKLEYNVRTLGKTPVTACIAALDCPDIPIKDCSEPGILLKKALKNRIYLYESCIAIEGDALYQSQIIDKLFQSAIGM